MHLQGSLTPPLLYMVHTFHVPTHVSIFLLVHHSWFCRVWFSGCFVTVNFSGVVFLYIPPPPKPSTGGPGNTLRLAPNIWSVWHWWVNQELNAPASWVTGVQKPPFCHNVVFCKEDIMYCFCIFVEVICNAKVYHRNTVFNFLLKYLVWY